MDSPGSPTSPSALSDTVQAAVQRVYKLPKCSKRRYSVLLDPPSGTCMEDLLISPKSSQGHLLQAVDYFRHAERANRRLAEFKAGQGTTRTPKTTSGASVRAKSADPLSKFRSAAEKVVVMNRLRNPMEGIGFGKAELGKTNDLKARLQRRKSTSF